MSLYLTSLPHFPVMDKYAIMPASGHYNQLTYRFIPPQLRKEGVFMLTLMLGRSGSGKSSCILQTLKEKGKHRAQILLVPEQSSYETERRLCEVNGNEASLYAEVFSFTSLAHRVAALGGGLANPILDEGGRLLVMYMALKAVSGNLSLFGPPSQKPEFLTQLISVVDDLKSCCVSPDQLSEIAGLTDGLSEKKLQDLALIYGTYDAMTAKGASDPRDQLTRLSTKLQSFPFAKGKDCYIDGFTDFTPQEAQVIEKLFMQAQSVTIALCCDSMQENEDPTGVFSSARHTAHLLLRMAQQQHIPVQVEVLNATKYPRIPAFAYLEQQLFAQSATPYVGECAGAISIRSARSRREEVSWTAGKIRELLQSGTYRARDIAVAARDIELYRDLISSVFAGHQIPIFQSAMQSILQKPVFTLITAALDVISGNFRYEDVFRYLKSGLSNLSPEECDSLENYVLLWNIWGSQWTSEAGFSRSPSGYDNRKREDEQRQLQELNEIRSKVVSPFVQLKRNMGDSSSSKVVSLYDFMEAIHLSDILEARTKELLTRGEPELALEYQQLWDILCKALEQCVDILGETPISLDEFSRLLRLLFSQYTVGSIPVSLDRVITGDLPRLSNRQVKALFILGAEESAIPQLLPRQGILSEEDQELLSDYGISLSPGIEAQMLREMTFLYNACAQPTERLFVSWPTAGEGGGEKYPSILVNQLCTLFPESQTKATQDLALMNDPLLLQVLALSHPKLHARMTQAPQYRDFVKRFEGASGWKRGALSPQSVSRLYGNTLALSPSRLDKYKSCRFAYFLQYGMQAKPRKSAGFHAPEYGTFVHYVLEFVLREGKTGDSLTTMSKARLEELTRAAISHYIKEVLGGLEQQTPRFRYLFLRLERTVSLVVQNVVDELCASDFQPIFFELGFGHGKDLPPIELTEGALTLSISGFVDRVDGWVKDDRLYLKVVDYKTGRKSFDFTDIWNGLGLQMLLYLFALEEHPEAFGPYELVPAGVLYLPARDVLISGSRSMPDELRKKMVEKELIRKGLILDEPSVLEALEFPNEGGPRFLPVRVSAKTGKVSGDALVSLEKLGRLKKHIQTILKDICLELCQGTISADPFWRGPNHNACQYCDYAVACHFDETLGEDRRRWIPSIRNSEFWSYLEEEGDDLDGDTAH